FRPVDIAMHLGFSGKVNLNTVMTDHGIVEAMAYPAGLTGLPGFSYCRSDLPGNEVKILPGRHHVQFNSCHFLDTLRRDMWSYVGMCGVQDDLFRPDIRKRLYHMRPDAVTKIVRFVPCAVGNRDEVT